MKRFITLLTTAVVAIALSGMASPQHRGGGGGRSASAGRPATTGLEHSEMTANSHGQRGIENAEAKQARPKVDHDKGRVDNDKGKSKNKKHKHSH